MARHLNTLLKASNYKTWIDYENREDWEQGNWRDNMLKVIQRCSFLVAVYTEEQGKATEFFYEIGMAKRSDVPVIFLKLPGIDIPDHIAKSGIGIVDTGNSLSKEWFETLEDLIQKA